MIAVLVLSWWNESLHHFTSVTIDFWTKIYMSFSIKQIPSYNFDHEAFGCNFLIFRVTGRKLIKVRVWLSMTHPLVFFQSRISVTVDFPRKSHMSFFVGNFERNIFGHDDFRRICYGSRLMGRNVEILTAVKMRIKACLSPELSGMFKWFWRRVSMFFLLLLLRRGWLKSVERFGSYSGMCFRVFVHVSVFPRAAAPPARMSAVRCSGAAQSTPAADRVEVDKSIFHRFIYQSFPTAA